MAFNMANDTGPGDKNTFSARRQACGCLGLPDGQHMITCIYNLSKSPPTYAAKCENCGFHSKAEHGVCDFCGKEMEKV